MNFHLEGQTVNVVVPFQNEAGAAIIPTAITARLFDGNSDLLMDLGAVSFNPAQSSTTVVVLGALNMISGDEAREARRLEVSITHAAGVTKKHLTYGVEYERSLTIMVNSFQTHETALVRASELVNLTRLTAATEERQKAALAEAFAIITGFNMVYEIRSDESPYRVISEHVLDADGWAAVTADVFKTQLPSAFKRALTRAQLFQADELLQGSAVLDKRRQGIVTETIAESSTTFSSAYSGMTVLGERARHELAAYMRSSYKIARA